MIGRRGPVLAMVVLFALVAAGCASPQAERPLPEGDAVRLGTVLSLTGSLSADGQLAREGYQFWQDWTNTRGGLEVRGIRHKIRMTIEDDQSRASLSAELTERLLDQVNLLLGPSNPAVVGPNAAIAQRHQAPMVVATAGSESIFRQANPFLFSVVGPASLQLRALVDVTLSLDPRPQTVAIIHANDSLSTEVAGSGADYAAGNGLSVVYIGRYPSGTNNLRGQLARAQAAGAEVLLEAGHEDESLLTVQQARELNLRPRLFGFTEGPSSERFSRLLQKDAELVVGAGYWSPLAKTSASGFVNNADYVTQFTAKFGHPPNWRSAAATAAGLALAAGIQNAGGPDPNVVRDALARLDRDSFMGKLRFDSNGVNLYRSLVVEQIQEGKRVLVWPPQLATGRAKYPAPLSESG